MNYSFVCYPQKHDIDLSAVLQGYDCAYILHDKDTEEDGVHYHVVVSCPTMAIARGLNKECGGNGYAEPVRSQKGIMAYLTHENNPEKHHYDVEDIQYCGDFNRPSTNDAEIETEAIEEVMNTIIADGLVCTDFWDFYHYMKDMCPTVHLDKTHERFISFSVLPTIARKQGEIRRERVAETLLARAVKRLREYSDIYGDHWSVCDADLVREIEEYFG